MDKIDFLGPKTKTFALTVKYIQKKMNDYRHMEYLEAYNEIADDENVTWFEERYPDIYRMIIKGIDYRLLAEIIVYFDRVDKGQIKESDLAHFLKNKFEPNM